MTADTSSEQMKVARTSRTSRELSAVAARTALSLGILSNYAVASFRASFTACRVLWSFMYAKLYLNHHSSSTTKSNLSLTLQNSRSVQYVSTLEGSNRSCASPNSPPPDQTQPNFPASTSNIPLTSGAMPSKAL